MKHATNSVAATPAKVWWNPFRSDFLVLAP
jgi:hypothetical protein